MPPPPLPGQSAPPPLPGQPIQAVPGTPAARPKQKRSCCCSGCLILMLLFLLGIGGLVGYAWVSFRTPESPVNEEFDSIPDYFPPESSFFSRLGDLS